MNKDVAEAIAIIASVPLGADTTEEYQEMKVIVLKALQVITDAAGFKEESKEAYDILTKRLQSPEFLEFLKQAS